MLVLKILGVLALALTLYCLISKFNKVCDENFSYKFFTIPSCLGMMAATLLLYLGIQWYRSAATSEGDVLNGILVAGIGVVIAIAIGAYNFKKTNLMYGLFGTAAQLAIFVPLAFIGTLVLFTVAFIWLLLVLLTAPSSRVRY